jgi:arylformamidase
MKLIDVSVPLDAKLASYPGNTPVELEPIKRLARGDSSNVSTLRMSVHGGTHVDAPRHFFDAGGDAAGDLARFDLTEDVRLLIKTHNSRLWGDPSFHPDYVGVGESAAKHLVDRGVKVVGVDYLSVEAFKTPGAPAHHILLRAGTIVIEGLNLRDVEPGVYEMYCLPLRLVGSDGAPARVVLRQS